MSRTTDRLSSDLATTGSRIIQLAGNINRLSSKAAFGHSAGGQSAQLGCTANLCSLTPAALYLEPLTKSPVNFSIKGRQG